MLNKETLWKNEKKRQLRERETKALNKNTKTQSFYQLDWKNYSSQLYFFF